MYDDPQPRTKKQLAIVSSLNCSDQLDKLFDSILAGID